MRHLIRGTEFEVQYRKFLGYDEGHLKDGDCDPPGTAKPKIRIRSSLQGLEKFETLLHEGLHGGLPDLREEVITELAHDCAAMIWKEMFEQA